MYTIRKEEKFSPTKVILHRSTSFGLGVTVFHLCLELHKIIDLVGVEAERNSSYDDEGSIQTPREASFDFQHGEEHSTDKSADKHVKMRLPVPPNPDQELQGLFIIAMLLYAKIFLCLVDIYSYALVRIASQKENICDCWLGLYLQIALLAYNMTEILIGAYKGTFDGSSMVLAARATVRAISIDMICLFLREIGVKQERDVFLYEVINV